MAPNGSKPYWGRGVGANDRYCSNSLLFIASACQSPRKLISTGGESSSSSETTTAPLPESQNPPQPGSNGSQESLPDCSRVEAKLTSTLRGFGWVQVRLRPEPYRYAEAWEDLHQLRQYLVIVTTLGVF